MDEPRFCLCGCGEVVTPDPAGRERKWINRHSRRGVKLTPEQIAQRTATRLANNGGVYQLAKGWKHSPETIARMTARNRERDYSGEKNPFFGKKHSAEFRAQKSASLQGELHHGWRGGVATLPYGPEFTRKFKRMIRERDGHRCLRCGVTREEYGRTLEVHHIDHNKSNNDPTNLATVCHSCNVWCSYHRDVPFVPLPLDG